MSPRRRGNELAEPSRSGLWWAFRRGRRAEIALAAGSSDPPEPVTASDEKPESPVAAKRWRLWVERLRTFALTPHVIPVACLSLVFAALYSIMGIVEHRAYRTAL